MAANGLISVTMLELIILVGLPASGKSTYYREHYAGTHEHVSKDLMPNNRHRDRRQLELIEAALAAGRAVVVDNTNPTPAVRAPLVELGRRHGARVIACYFETNVKDSVARNRGREGKARVPDVAIFSTAKKLVPPTFKEGFDEVRIVAAPPAPH
jgi:predicted kinase